MQLYDRSDRREHHRQPATITGKDLYQVRVLLLEQCDNGVAIKDGRHQPTPVPSNAPTISLTAGAPSIERFTR